MLGGISGERRRGEVRDQDRVRSWFFQKHCPLNNDGIIRSRTC